MKLLVVLFEHLCLQGVGKGVNDYRNMLIYRLLQLGWQSDCKALK